MSLGLCMFTELIMSLLNYLSSLSYNKNKECSIPEWAMPPEIRTTFHALRGRTMTMSLLNGPTSVHKCERKEKFACTGIFGSRIFYKHLQWSVDEAEWKCKKNSKGRKKYQVLKRYNIHTGIIIIIIIIIIIYSLCICHSRNFSSCNQRGENWFYLNNPAKPCRYIFNFH